MNEQINIGDYMARESRKSLEDHDRVAAYYATADPLPEQEKVSRWDTWGSMIVLAVAFGFFIYMGFFYN